MIPQKQKKVRPQKGESLLRMEADYTVIDIETTGLDPGLCGIIEIGALKVSGGKVQESFSQLIDPGYPLDPYITYLTGIRDEMLAGMPKIGKVMPRFMEFVEGEVLVGHNVHFDVNFLYDAAIACLGRPLSNPFIDTLRISRRLFKEYENHKLSTLVKKFCIAEGTEHRALSDCYATHGCYEYMKEYIRQSGRLLLPVADGKIV